MPEATLTAPTPTTQPTAAPAAPAQATTDKPSAPASPFAKLDERTKVAPKPADKPSTAAPTDKKEDKPASDTPKDDKAPVAPTEKRIVEAPRVLRDKLDAVTKEKESATTRLKELEAKLADYEKSNGDTKALSEQYSALEKNHKLLQERIAGIDYSQSDEFKAKFEAPFATAAEKAKSVIEQLTITDPETQAQRAATYDDFVQLYQLPYGKAAQMADQLFGSSQAAAVMRHYDKLKDMQSEKDAALKNHAATAGEREKASRAEKLQRDQKINTAWEATNKNLVEAHPDWFGEDPEDVEGNELLRESAKTVDQAYTGRNNLTDDEKIIIDAHIRNRAIAFPRMARKVALQAAEIADLKGRLEDKAESTPGATKKAVNAKPEESSGDLLTDLKKANIFS